MTEPADTHTLANADEWPEFLLVWEIAVILRVSKMTVYRLIHNEEIHATRVGGRNFRVPANGLRDYLRKSGIKV